MIVVGASGNVGPFAVQIAKARGANVTGVCRTEKVAFVQSLGADHVVNRGSVPVSMGDGQALRMRYDPATMRRPRLLRGPIGL